MSANEFITKNVNEIYNDKNYEFPLNAAMASAWILGNFKGINLKVLDMKKTTSLADYFIMASASNMTQAMAMADTAAKELRKCGMEILSKEGFNASADWILIDLGDVIIHIFQETARGVYDLDNLWDVPSIEIPNEYYYSEESESKQDEEKSYF